MVDDQESLIAAFPAFVGGIEAALDAVESFHVGVVTTDAYAFNTCDVLGGLVTRTGGSGSSDATCGPYANGLSFMTKADDLAEAFACAAQVGIDGDGAERPMEAMMRAIGGALANPGGCNEGSCATTPCWSSP